jgi:hypothetical protein
VTLTWIASTDNVGVSSYEIRRNGSVITTVPTPGYTDTGRVNGTLYSYEVRALDLAGNVSAPATDSATPRVLGNAVVRVNSGGEGFVDVAGNTWYSDYGFNIGSTSTSAAAIAGTDDDQLYQSERFDGSPNGESLLYAFDLPNGHYEVKLHFAEVWSGASGEGLRVFDVNAEGNLVVDDMDIFARVGANRACTTTFPVFVSDGQLNIGFLHGVQNPKICGIEVFEIMPVVQPPQTFEQWLTVNGLTGQTDADSDKGGLDNLAEFELQMDPNDSSDDLGFRLRCTVHAGSPLIILPVLKPIGNYHLHRDTDLTDIGNVANRIDTVTKAEIEAMTPEQRASYTVPDPAGGPRATGQPFFLPQTIHSHA